MRRHRAAFTVLELLVALAICGIALAALARVCATEDEVLGSVADRSNGRAELTVAAGTLPTDLADLGDVSDIRAGQARDTAVEFRQTIATAVVCDTVGGVVALAPSPPPPASAGGASADSSPRLASALRTPQAGDSTWTLDSARVWRPAAVTAVLAPTAGVCGPGGPVLSTLLQATQRVRLRLSDNAAVAPGSVLRITRPFRYSFYKSSDRLWYLGARDWNVASARFNTIQPVAGPFAAPSAGGTSISYLGGGGELLAQPVADPTQIAAVRLTLLAAARRRLATHAAGAAVDTAVILVHVRRGTPP